VELAKPTKQLCFTWNT